MANKNLFQTVKGMFTPKTNAINEASGTAHRLFFEFKSYF